MLQMPSTCVCYAGSAGSTSPSALCVLHAIPSMIHHPHHPHHHHICRFESHLHDSPCSDTRSTTWKLPLDARDHNHWLALLRRYPRHGLPSHVTKDIAQDDGADCLVGLPDRADELPTAHGDENNKVLSPLHFTGRLNPHTSHHIDRCPCKRRRWKAAHTDGTNAASYVGAYHPSDAWSCGATISRLLPCRM